MARTRTHQNSADIDSQIRRVEEEKRQRCSSRRSAARTVIRECTTGPLGSDLRDLLRTIVCGHDGFLFRLEPTRARLIAKGGVRSTGYSPFSRPASCCSVFIRQEHHHTTSVSLCDDPRSITIRKSIRRRQSFTCHRRNVIAARSSSAKSPGVPRVTAVRID